MLFPFSKILSMPHVYFTILISLIGILKLKIFYFKMVELNSLTSGLPNKCDKKIPGKLEPE